MMWMSCTSRTFRSGQASPCGPSVRDMDCKVRSSCLQFSDLLHECPEMLWCSPYHWTAVTSTEECKRLTRRTILPNAYNFSSYRVTTISYRGRVRRTQTSHSRLDFLYVYAVGCPPISNQNFSVGIQGESVAFVRTFNHNVNEVYG